MSHGHYLCGDRRACAIINLDLLKENIKRIRELAGNNSELMCVVKANAYGHGDVDVSKAAESLGIKWFGVATAGEGLKLRKYGISGNILVFSHVDRSMLEQSLNSNLTLTVCTLDYAEHLSKTAQKIGVTSKIHIKIDTGMGRIGFSVSDESLTQCLAIKKLPNIIIEGLFSHLAVAVPGNEFSERQVDLFDSFAEKLHEGGLSIPVKHIANSGGILSGSRFSKDMVRAGIMLYGQSPHDEVKLADYGIRPWLTLKSYIVFIKEIDEATSVGYSRTFYADRKMKIATIPIGYGDGYSRLMSNKGEVLIHGKRAKIVGNVCMDSFMVDVTHIPDAAVGDEIVLLGRQQEQEITGYELAKHAKTIEYEVLTSLNERIERTYINNR